MSAYNSKPVYSDQGHKGHTDRGSGPFCSDSVSDGWSDSDGFSVGFGDQPLALAINGFADSGVDFSLQGVVPGDYASVSISLSNVLNLNAFANAAATGNITSEAASQASVTLTNGKVTGSYVATLTIDATAYVAADHAMVHMLITDSFQLTLSGYGYVGASVAEASVAGGTVNGPSGGGTAGGGGPSSDGAFDLARFAASVLNTGQWNIAFAASAPGESLKGEGLSVLTISATADLSGNHRPKILSFHDTERAKFAFSDTSTPAAGIHPGMLQSSSGPPSLFHND